MDNNDIPKGSTVIIPKGTEIRSYSPSESHRVAGRSYRVKVDHTLGATLINVGTRFYKDGVPVRESLHLGRRDAVEVANTIGGTDADTLRAHAVEYDKSPVAASGPDYRHLYVEVAPATVRWAGKGGYWNWVPVTAVKLAD